VPKIRRNFYD